MTKNRFRFRAWDKSFQKYCENVIVSTINGEITVYERLVDGNTALIPSTHVVLEQCTGLKDKNGRLIYENDVVKITGDVMTIPIFYEESKAFVNWDEDGFFLHFESGEIERLFQECWEYEVVGNLHENPELLEDR